MRLYEPVDHYSYYCSQAGRGHHQFGGAYDDHHTGSFSNFNVFRGVPHQRGYGVFSNVLRRFGVPLLKYLAPKLVKTGKEIASDIYLREMKPKDAFKSRLREGGKEFLRDGLNSAAAYANEHFAQDGSGIERHRLNFTPHASGVNRTAAAALHINKVRKRRSSHLKTGSRRRRTKTSSKKRKKSTHHPLKRKRKTTRSNINVFI